MITPDDIRRDLEGELGRVLPDPAWDFLVERGYLADVVVADMTIHELAKQARDHLHAWGHPTPTRTTAPSTPPSTQRAKAPKIGPVREDVVSCLLAAEAARDEQVRSFRQEALGDAVLAQGHVDGWIKRQAEEGGPPSSWLTVPVPKGYKVKPSTRTATTEPPLTISEKTPAILIQKQYLSYRRYGMNEMVEDPISYEPTAEGSVLERLRRLSADLARRYGWDESFATNFVLTDEVPPVHSIDIEESVSSHYETQERILMTIDPALSPREVADHYRRFRGQIVGRRHRELSEKHMRLATFTAARAGESLRKRMAAWNKEHPDWRYKEKRNFDRDCKQAIQRLLHPDYGPKIEL